MPSAAAPDPLPRAALLDRLRERRRFDLAVIGGGATGLGVALDAAARGLTVVLLESDDFSQGTSSRATKLVHGGVRYLAQGNIGLVREALHERSVLLANAPHAAQRLAFVVPAFRLWEGPFYGIGLKMYDALAGRQGLGPTEWLSPRRTAEALPTVRREGLTGGIKYWDGQFDDSRVAVLLARTAAARGALVVNHAPVVALRRETGKITGVVVQDTETGERFDVEAGCVVNATGVWVDALRDMDRDESAPRKPPMVAPSQGVHLVVDRSFLPGTHALMVPKTADGRVLFAVPWLGKIILGTTDTPRDDIVREPAPFREEVDFILREAGRYLAKTPTRADVRSVWVGLRPLVKPEGDADDTKSISREHSVLVGRSGMVTVTGGKWTTYRAMAEDVLEQCMARRLLPRRPGGVTVQLPLLGAAPASHSMADAPGDHSYGTEATALRELPGATRWLWRESDAAPGALSEAMVRFAARFEMARSVEDVLARRSRLLFLDAKLAAAVADDVAAILADELGSGFDAAASAQAFKVLAAQYGTAP